MSMTTRTCSFCDEPAVSVTYDDNGASWDKLYCCDAHTDHNDPSVELVEPTEPSPQMVRAGLRALDAWSDDTLAQEIDGAEMARRVYRAMSMVRDDS